MVATMPGGPCPAAPRVLVVEDRPSIRHLITVALEQEGMEIGAAASAEDALDLLSARLPDVVVLDLLMPGAGGARLARLLRTGAATRHIPVIVVSGLDGDPAAIRALDAQEFLPKPFDVRDLVRAVRHHLGPKASWSVPADVDPRIPPRRRPGP